MSAQDFGYENLSLTAVKDELMLQSTLLDSLKSTGQGHDLSARGFKARILALKKRLAQLQGKTLSQVEAESSSSSPATPRLPTQRTDADEAERFFGSKPRSTIASMSSSLKRGSGHLDLTDEDILARKSRRTSPAPQARQGWKTDANGFIDLTGDDDYTEILAEQRKNYEREQRRGKQLKEDERLARMLSSQESQSSTTSNTSTVRPPTTSQNRIQHTLPELANGSARGRHTPVATNSSRSSNSANMPSVATTTSRTLVNLDGPNDTTPSRAGPHSHARAYAHTPVQFQGSGTATSPSIPSTTARAPARVLDRWNRPSQQVDHLSRPYSSTGQQASHHGHLSSQLNKQQATPALGMTSQSTHADRFGRVIPYHTSRGSAPSSSSMHRGGESYAYPSIPGSYPTSNVHSVHAPVSSWQNRGPSVAPVGVIDRISSSGALNLNPVMTARTGAAAALSEIMRGAHNGVNYAGSFLSNITNRYARDPFASLDVDSVASEFYNSGGAVYPGLVDYQSREETEQQMRELLNNIQSDVDLAKENWAKTPDGMSTPLYPHQQVALTWLKRMEQESNKGGILADDMGLGKTISTLAIMISNKSTDPARKTTLIVGPLALITQWEQEIKNKLVGKGRLTTYIYHNRGSKVNFDELRTYDVVLTTYGTLGAEFSRWEKWQEEIRSHADNPHYERNANEAKKRFPLTGDKSLWYRVVLDEAQCIKNKNTKTAQGAYRLNSKYRFCLTGTPMMNSVNEMFSLIHFLRIKPYNDFKKFNSTFGCLTNRGGGRGDTDAAMQKLQAVLKAILLRRTKKSTIDGKPLLVLPEKIEQIEHAEFDEEQNVFYRALETQSAIQFNKYVKEGTVGKNYSNILVLLLRLRQAACHPHLIMDYEESVNEVAPPNEVLEQLAKSLDPDVIKRISEIESFECSVCYDGVPNPKLVIPCGHDICSECLVRLSESNIRAGILAGNETSQLKCPTCRGPIDLQKVIDYNIFKKVHVKGDSKTAGADAEDGSSTDSDDDSNSETEAGSGVDEKGNLAGFVVEDESSYVDSDEDEDSKTRKQKVMEKGKKAKKTKKAMKAKGKGKAKEEKIKHTSLPQLKRLAAKGGEGRRRYYKYLRDNFQTSAKLEKTMEVIRRAQKTGEKTIVFSQFTTLLDLLEIPIQDEGVGYTRYDGSMNSDARQASVDNFKTNPHTKVMLVSLRAGNAGLNLTVASQIIIMDPAWNPYIEMQAVDRAHRIGQIRDVHVSRILIEQTVEDRIMDLQEKKRKLVDQALDEGVSQRMGRLTQADFNYLFNGGQLPI